MGIWSGDNREETREEQDGTTASARSEPSRDGTSRQPAPAPGGAVIGPSITIDGEVTGSEDLTIDGRVTGLEST